MKRIEKTRFICDYRARDTKTYKSTNTGRKNMSKHKRFSLRDNKGVINIRTDSTRIIST